LLLYPKTQKKLAVAFISVMSISSSAIMSPEEMIFTFKQGSEESFREAWLRINSYYETIEPRMTLALLLRSFYFGIALRYRYALDTLAGGDFLQYGGDQAFNAIKKLIATYNSPSSIDFQINSICARLNTLETHSERQKECYNMLREKLDHVPLNSEPTNWLPAVKIVIDGKTFYARCDIMSEFCLMPKDIYDSLNLWELTKGGERIPLTNNTFIQSIGIAEGVHTKILGSMVSTDYLVIECTGKGQITLGRSLLKLMKAKIDVGEGVMTINSPRETSHSFPHKKRKGKRGKRKAPANNGLNASSSFENT
jgi:hypothetical protein